MFKIARGVSGQCVESISRICCYMSSCILQHECETSELTHTSPQTGLTFDPNDRPLTELHIGLKRTLLTHIVYISRGENQKGVSDISPTLQETQN